MLSWDGLYQAHVAREELRMMIGTLNEKNTLLEQRLNLLEN